jgi:hypothetical protein
VLIFLCLLLEVESEAPAALIGSQRIYLQLAPLTQIQR